MPLLCVCRWWKTDRIIGHKTVDASWGLVSDYGFEHKHKDSHMLSPVRGMLAQACCWLLSVFGWLQHIHTHSHRHIYMHSHGVLPVQLQNFTDRVSGHFLRPNKGRYLGVFWYVGCENILQRGNAISRSRQEITPTASVQQPGTQAVHTHATHRQWIFSCKDTHTHTSQHTGSQHQCSWP